MQDVEEGHSFYVVRTRSEVSEERTVLNDEGT
jgi:hypothetical protein